MKIDIENKLYPEQLRKIINPPKQLYLKGNVKLLDTIGIAIIGARDCTKYGEKMASKFSEELSLYGITIVSGMAKGIDSFAHIGCIETTGNTIAVLPCGLKNIYPKENKELYNKILENNGLIITEYEENEKASSKKFLERNRIVSGLAIGTLVIEGGYRSGTSVTARLTKQQNKNVFCIPSSLENIKGIAPNKLIKEGAILVTEVEDIINKYPEINFKKVKRKNKIKKSVNNTNFKDNKEYENNNIKEEYKQIYNILEQKMHINDIAKKLKLDINEINYKLIMLELEDKIVSLPGNIYIRK